MKSGKQRVVLNGQHLSWTDVFAGYPQGFIFAHLLFFFYYVNDLFDGFQCNPNLFANDTSLFATVHNINKATSDLINDLTKITKWDFQWKMSLNPGIFKQAQEVIFSCKRSAASRPPLTFNKIRVA